MKVSIVIVSYNVSTFLNECLYSIKKETNCTYEIIVVDNNSEDESVEIVKRNHPGVHIIESQENLGFAKANNVGFRKAKGDYVFMLNPDTVILDSAIDRLVHFMDENPEIGACGPKNLNPDLTLQYNCHHFPTLSMSLIECLQLKRFFPKNKFFGREHMTYWNYNEVKEVDWITGCSLLFRKKLLDQIGDLDENYFMYSEECDFCYRLKQQIWKTVFNPRASLVHYGGQSSMVQNIQDVYSRTIFRYMFDSKYYFFRKHYGKTREFFLRLLYAVYFSFSLFKNLIMITKKNRRERIDSAKVVIFSALNKS